MDTSLCDFCSKPVEFAKVYDDYNVFWWMEAVEANAGSDYLAIWCSSCGAKHRQ